MPLREFQGVSEMADSRVSVSSKPPTRKAGRVMWIIVAVVLVGVLLFAGVLVSWSPGKPQQMRDEDGRPIPGSISEKTYVKINGIDQGMFIQGRDASKPVLLFLHGGPGMPEYFLNQTHPSGLEDDFVVCWWEQRGAGLSYDADIPAASMTVEQLVDDTVEVTNYLRKRFGQDRIYLMGHSWGSFLGIQLAERAPELYHAYIGMAQVSYQLKSEQLAYDFELADYRKRGNTKMVRKLEAAPVSKTAPLSDGYMKLRDPAMHQIGVGTTRDMDSVVTGIFVPVWQTRDYTMREKVNIGRGKKFSHGILWNDFLTTDLTREVPELALPVYFVHGEHDYTVSYTEAKAYFDKLKAPVKGFYTFENSAHSPAFEEPEKMRRILAEDVLAGRVSLADRR
jgi:pimeloyl-ACP methyl ester carboxylesterase